MIEICNLRNTKPTQPYDFKVDRSSPLGNPYYMQFEEQRNEVCDKYERWFYKQIEESESFRDTVEALMAVYVQTRKLRLFCWCSPKRCHAETIKKYIEENTK